MEINWSIIFVSLLSAFGTGLYIKDTLQGKTKPNKINWFIWGMAPLIGVSATFVSEGFVWSMVPVFMAGLMPLLIVIASFFNKKSYWKIEKLDYICLFLAVLSLILWGITSAPLIAIILVVIVDLLGGALMVKKMYKFPETENIYPFVMGMISNGTGLYFIKNWKPEEYLFPLYLFLFCITLVILFYRKKFIYILKITK